jgi:hypothetical protein
LAGPRFPISPVGVSARRISRRTSLIISFFIRS